MELNIKNIESVSKVSHKVEEDIIEVTNVVDEAITLSEATVEDFETSSKDMFEVENQIKKISDISPKKNRGVEVSPFRAVRKLRKYIN